MTLLFCRHVAVADTHLLDNRGFHRLLIDPDFQDFLQEPTPNNVGPLIAYLRPNAKGNFEASLEDLVKNKARFFVLSKEVRETKLYTPTGKQMPLDEVYNLSRTDGIDFEIVIHTLQRTLSHPGNLVTWDMPYDRYSRLVKVFLNDFWNSYGGKTNFQALKLRDELLEAIDNPKSSFPGSGYAGRSDLYAIVDKCPYSVIQRHFKRIFLDPVYRFNFPFSHQLNPGSGFSFQNDLTPAVRSVVAKGHVLKEDHITVEWNQPILEQLTWEQLGNIRDNTFFKNLDSIESAAKTSSPQEVQKAISEHIRYLDERTRKLLPKDAIYQQSNKVSIGLATSGIAVGVASVYGAFLSGSGLTFSLGNAIVTVDATLTATGGAMAILSGAATIVRGVHKRHARGYAQFKVTLDTASKELREVLGKA